METEQAVQFEHILWNMSVGIAILDCATLRIRYANPYIRKLLDEPWSQQEIAGKLVTEVLPPPVSTLALPYLQAVAQTGEPCRHAEVPYEGSLETRGRTYWRLSVERSCPKETPELLVTVEDVTETVRSRLHLKTIHHISSAIAGPSALPVVLDRILEALQELVGSTRCAVMLLDSSITSSDVLITNDDDTTSSAPPPPHATVAAQKGLHPRSQDWQPVVSNRLLLGRVIQKGQTILLTDTRSTRSLDLPLLDDQGKSCRPGSVLSVPIFDPYPSSDDGETPYTLQTPVGQTKAVLGTIEVYHRRPRGFPQEEVELLERFAQQAGLAIQNARLFRGIDRWARTANRQARQKDNIMQAMPDPVIIFDPRWRVADTNSAARRLFGWDGEVIGLPIMQAITRSKAEYPPDLPLYENPIEELERRALTAYSNEIRVIGADGQSYTLRCTYTPIRDHLGDIFAFILIYHDLTEEIAARERIEAEVIARTAELDKRNQALECATAEQELANARMALMLERLPSGVILVSAEDNSITMINNRAVEALQKMGIILEPRGDPAEAGKHALGMDCVTLLRSITVYGTSGSVLPFEEQPLYRAMQKGEASEAEIHMTRPDGQPLYLLMNSAPLRSPDGTITSAVLVLHDISRLKTLERAREDFFTTMAHELKTPLANIRANLSALLANDLQSSPVEPYEYLKTADEQVERIVRMVNQLLDASRVEAGALRLDWEPLILPELLEDLQERLEALISHSHRELQVTLPDHVPAVAGDYELIMSVLSNLLSNAFRYAPEGDIVRLDVEPLYDTATNLPTGVTLRVVDRGPGLTKEQQISLFTRFSTFTVSRRPLPSASGQPLQERRPSHWSSTSGLGLYISRGIIEAHGSKLTLDSSPGHGATFSFTLPVFTGQKEYEKRGHQLEESQENVHHR